MENKDNTEYLVNRFVDLLSAENESEYTVTKNRLDNTYVSPRSDYNFASYIENESELEKVL